MEAEELEHLEMIGAYLWVKCRNLSKKSKIFLGVKV